MLGGSAGVGTVVGPGVHGAATRPAAAGAGDPLQAAQAAVRASAARVLPLRGKISQDRGERRAAQAAQRGGLDLPRPLAGHAEAPAHLLEGALVVVDEAEAELDDAPLARRQRGED